MLTERETEAIREGVSRWERGLDVASDAAFAVSAIVNRDNIGEIYGSLPEEIQQSFMKLAQMCSKGTDNWITIGGWYSIGGYADSRPPPGPCPLDQDTIKVLQDWYVTIQNNDVSHD